MSKSGIYCIKNIVNGKVYIGSTNNLQRRLNDHKRELNEGTHINDHLQKSWNKYGENCFDFFVLKECGVEDLLTQEDYYISVFDSLNPEKGYNLISADRTMISESTREKLSKSSTGRVFSDETKEKMRLAKLGKKFTSEHIQKLRESKKGTHLSEEARRKVSEYQKSRPMTEERKKQLDEARKKSNEVKRGMKLSEAQRKVLSESHKGRQVSAETREKLRKANMGKQFSKETREKLKRFHSNRKGYEKTCIVCGEKFLNRSPNPHIRCPKCMKGR